MKRTGYETFTIWLRKTISFKDIPHSGRIFDFFRCHKPPPESISIIRRPVWRLSQNRYFMPYFRSCVFMTLYKTSPCMDFPPRELFHQITSSRHFIPRPCSTRMTSCISFSCARSNSRRNLSWPWQTLQQTSDKFCLRSTISRGLS